MLPLATTTVTFKRPAAEGDPYEDAAMTTVAANVPAYISSPSGRETQAGGQREAVDAVLGCEVVADVDHYCIAIDDNTADRWNVSWVRRRSGLGLDHLEAGLIAISGGSSG